MANSVDPNQTAPIGAVCSGSTLFASILKTIICSRRHFQIHFLGGTLRVKPLMQSCFCADQNKV